VCFEMLLAGPWGGDEQKAKFRDGELIELLI
jgi:hypothetical protein